MADKEIAEWSLVRGGGLSDRRSGVAGILCAEPVANHRLDLEPSRTAATFLDHSESFIDLAANPLQRSRDITVLAITSDVVDMVDFVWRYDAYRYSCPSADVGAYDIRVLVALARIPTRTPCLSLSLDVDRL